VKALILCLALYSTAIPLLSQDIVLKNSGLASSLIELYSSEGCSSCPPAEAWVNNLKRAPGLWKDIFPVAFHVDYWDGLGWPDRFARAEYTQRQRNYAAQLGQDSVYTPEFIVNGLEWRRGWFNGTALPSSGPEKAGSLSLAVSMKENKISASYTPGSSASSQLLMLNVALLGFNLVTDVKRGENGGRTLEHDFVVLSFSSIPLTSDSNGAFRNAPVEMKSSTDDVPGAVVAWVSTNTGSILQVTGGWLSPADQPSN
jgi:hypothetical protein